MNSQKKIYRPRTGMRFHIRGCEFEVCFAETGMVRYASTKGGNPYRITFERFLELQKEEDGISILNVHLHGQDEINGTVSIANLTDDELGNTMRHLRYAEAATAELVFPNSIAHLKAWVPIFAKLIKDAAAILNSWVINMSPEIGYDEIWMSHQDAKLCATFY